MNFWRRRRLMNEAEDLRILEMTALPTETEKDTVQTTGLFAITERDGWWQSCVVTAVVALILMWLEPYIKPANAVRSYRLRPLLSFLSSRPFPLRSTIPPTLLFPL